MSWSIGFDAHWNRDIGYGVPAFCDHPCCDKEIDRGLDYVCGGEPKGGEYGCGLYFCGRHHAGKHSLCPRCRNKKPPYPLKPDHPKWIHHKETDESWAQWRACRTAELIERIRHALEDFDHSGATAAEKPWMRLLVEASRELLRKADQECER